jgi:hypothetical protein
MFRLIHYKMKFRATILLLLLGMSCTNPQSSNKSTKKLTPSEILSYFIKTKLKKERVDGNYFFVCEGFCKGCVQQTLFSLDSLYSTVEPEKEWTILTSSKYVRNLPIQNIRILYDEEWSKVNYVFNDVTYVKFINDSIIISQTIDSENLNIIQ